MKKFSLVGERHLIDGEQHIGYFACISTPQVAIKFSPFHQFFVILQCNSQRVARKWTVYQNRLKLRTPL